MRGEEMTRLASAAREVATLLSCAACVWGLLLTLGAAMSALAVDRATRLFVGGVLIYHVSAIYALSRIGSVRRHWNWSQLPTTAALLELPVLLGSVALFVARLVVPPETMGPYLVANLVIVPCVVGLVCDSMRKRRGRGVPPSSMRGRSSI